MEVPVREEGYGATGDGRAEYLEDCSGRMPQQELGLMLGRQRARLSRQLMAVRAHFCPPSFSAQTRRVQVQQPWQGTDREGAGE